MLYLSYLQLILGQAVKISCQTHSNDNSLGLIILYLLTFSLCFRFPLCFGSSGFASDTHTTWLWLLRPRPISKWHFVMPTCHPFSARATWMPYSRWWPCRGNKLQTEWPASLAISLRGLHQYLIPSPLLLLLPFKHPLLYVHLEVEEDKLFSSYGHDESWC